jgi:predicted nucleic acid-binding protein
MNQLISVFFQEALEDFVIVPMEESILSFSFDLVLESDLRTLDSLQLSAALSLSQEVTGLEFVSADQNLVATAERRGLTTVVPG